MLVPADTPIRVGQPHRPYQSHAMGVDNTTNMRLYAGEQGRLLAEAKAKLEGCRALLA